MTTHIQHQEGFYREIAEDPAITPIGICLYQCLFYLCTKSNSSKKVLINRQEVEQMIKISRTTYHKALKALQARGYIKYTPSFNHFLGSLIEFYGFPETVLTIKVNKYEIFLTTR